MKDQGVARTGVSRPPHLFREWRSHLLRHVAQLEFLDLAGRGLRELCEHDVARALVAREVLAAPGNELVLARGLPGLELDEGAGGLAPFLVGLGHDRGGLHRRVLVERVLDLDAAISINHSAREPDDEGPDK
jgi:hypothetical protein